MRCCFLMEAQEAGKTVVGYGAPAKATTLLNCGVKTDLMAYTVDISPLKHGNLLPGTRIPIYPPEDPGDQTRLRPDHGLEHQDEIMKNMAAVRDWGGKFVVPLPAVEVLDWAMTAPEAGRGSRPPNAAGDAMLAKRPSLSDLPLDHRAGVRETLHILKGTGRRSGSTKCSSGTRSSTG